MNLNLTGRQQHILLAIVMDYIATAEPVGSRTIAKKYDLGLSPATIRNDMAELEELGLLVQPHLSAGRIPSDFGYRNFVDFLMQKPSLSEEDMVKIKALNNNNISNLEFVIEQSARVLSALSNTTAIIQFPDSQNEFVKHFQLLPINDMFFIIVLVSSTGKVSDYRIQLEKPVEEGFFTYLTNYFNEQLISTPINLLGKKLQELIRSNREHDDILINIYSSIKETAQIKKNKLCVAGTSNLLKEPEFIQKEKAHSIIDFFENEQHLKEFEDIFIDLSSTSDQELKHKILIGKEIKIEQLQNCSMIVSSYKIGDSITGSVGLLGPTRMQYGKSIATLEEVVKNMSYLLTKVFGVKSDF